MKTLVLGILLGAGGGIVGTKELLAEHTGAKTWFVHGADLRQQQLPDGGTSVSVTGFLTGSVVLKDGGSGVADLGGSPCALTKSQENAAKALMNACAPP